MHKSRRRANPSPAMHTGRIRDRGRRANAFPVMHKFGRRAHPSPAMHIGRIKDLGEELGVPRNHRGGPGDAAGVHHLTTVRPAANFVHRLATMPKTLARAWRGAQPAFRELPHAMLCT
jgi:hypothetical protein